MWFKLASATFTNNLGTMSELSNSWPVSYSLSGGISKNSCPSSVAKNGAGTQAAANFTATFTLASGSTLNHIKAFVGGAQVGTTVTSGNSITIPAASITGPVTIEASATGSSGGGGGEPTYTITYKYMSGSTEIKTATTETVAAGTSKTFSTSNAPIISGYAVSSVSPTSATINSNTTVTYSYVVASTTELTLLETFAGQIDKSNVGTTIVTGQTNLETHTSSKYLLPAGISVTITVEEIASASSFAVTDKDNKVLEIVAVNNGPVDGVYTFKAYSEECYFYTSNKYLQTMSAQTSTVLNLVPVEANVLTGQVLGTNTVGSAIQFAGAENGNKTNKYNIPAGMTVTLTHVNAGNYGFAMTDLNNIVTEFTKTNSALTATDETIYEFKKVTSDSYLYVSANKLKSVTGSI